MNRWLPVMVCVISACATAPLSPRPVRPSQTSVVSSTASPGSVLRQRWREVLRSRPLAIRWPCKIGSVFTEQPASSCRLTRREGTDAIHPPRQDEHTLDALCCEAGSEHFPASIHPCNADVPPARPSARLSPTAAARRASTVVTPSSRSAGPTEIADCAAAERLRRVGMCARRRW